MRTTLAIAAALVLAPAALAQDYGQGPTTYYLHRLSTYQQGCWGPCACVLSARQPTRGTFTLSLVSVGNATDFYAISSVDFTTTSLNGITVLLTGSGTFAAGQVPFNPNQSMTLNLTLAPAVNGAAQHTFTTSGTFSRTVPPPAIEIDVADSTTGCPGVRMHISASPRRSDWNSDGGLQVQDIFDFLADWFAGRGDYDASGATTVADIFAMLNDWFAGV